MSAKAPKVRKLLSLRFGAGNAEPVAAFVEDSLVKCVVPEWVDPRGYQLVPSSLQLHALRTAQDADAPDEIRMASLSWLDRIHRNPVAKQRRQFVDPVLAERASHEGRNPREILRDSVHRAFLLSEPSSSTNRPFEQSFRTQLNDLITKDFLGSDWRNDFKKTELPPDLESVDDDPEQTLLNDEGQTERQLFLNRLEAGLSGRERDLLKAVRRGLTAQDWGTEQSLKPATVRTMMHRIRTKGRKMLNSNDLD